MKKFTDVISTVLGEVTDRLMDTVPVGIFITDPAGRCIYVNEYWSQLANLTSEEAMGEGWTHALHPEDRHDLYQAWQEFIAGMKRFNREHRYLRADNSTSWVHVVATTVRDSQAKVVGVIGYVIDITEIKAKQQLAEQAMAKYEEENRFNREVAATMPSLLWAFNLEQRRFTYINKRSLDIWGYTPEEVRAMGEDYMPTIVHPEDLAIMAEAANRVEKLQDGQILDLEFRARHKNGRTVWCHARLTIFRRDANGRPIETLGITEDITERIEALGALDEERARTIHASKMASLGEMAGSIAHEINNPLAIIAGKAYQLKAAAESGKLDLTSVAQIAGKIEETGFRISKIIQGLRSFSRKGEQDPFARASLRTIVDDTLELCRQRFQAHGIRLDVKAANTEIECRAVQISQVLLNLLNNAFDATERLGDRWVEIETREVPGKFVEILVTDSGTGIPAALREKIMLPFFTTKKGTRGTGLGLSISQSIIVDHGGELTVDETCPNTRFKIRLPVVQAKTKSSVKAA